jgi:hypothetical protein
LSPLAVRREPLGDREITLPNTLAKLQLNASLLPIVDLSMLSLHGGYTICKPWVRAQGVITCLFRCCVPMTCSTRSPCNTSASAISER